MVPPSEAYKNIFHELTAEKYFEGREKQFTEVLGKRISRIAFGTARIGGDKDSLGEWVRKEGQAEVDIQVLRSVLASGINNFDTAESYANGNSERLIGEAFLGVPRELLFVADKIYKSTETNPTADMLLDSVRAMGHRLQLKPFDLLYVHEPYEPFEVYIEALNKAVDLGLARGIGVSRFTFPQLLKAQELSRYPISALEASFSLAERRFLPPEYLNYCRENSIQVFAYRPVLGMFSDSVLLEKVAKVADRHKATPAQIALSWVLHHKGVIPIVRAHNPEHLKENIAAYDIKLTEIDMSELS